ncbi:MAG: SRPBCC family protein, partial [Chloroflexota bacterium]
MGERGQSRETSASAEKVWAIWVDTSTWGQWNPNVTTMDMPAPVALGKDGVMNTPAGQHHQMKVVEFEPGRSFTLETSVIPLSRFRFACSVEPAGGRTRVKQTVKVVGPMGWLFDPMMGDQIAK